MNPIELASRQHSFQELNCRGGSPNFRHDN